MLTTARRPLLITALAIAGLIAADYPPPSARLDAIEPSLTPELGKARPRILSSDEFRTLLRAR